jgi:hypothetical protein
MQNKFEKQLPVMLRSWEFLPTWMRSLQPYDSFIRKYLVCGKFGQNLINSESSSSNSLTKNPSVVDKCAYVQTNKAFEAEKF